MKKPIKQISYLLLLLYLALIFISPPKHINYPKLLIINVIKFPLSVFNRLCDNIIYVAGSKNLLKENKDLYQQVQVLSGKLTQMEEIKAENSRLREIISFKETSPLKFIACPVIAKDSSNLSRSIIIGAGKKQGIKEETVVTTASGIVGRVIESSSGTSRVLLITDPNSHISAINNRSRCEGMLYGMSNGLCKMVYLPLDADIKEGDMIVTSGSGSYFPKGLMLGTVIKKAESSRGLYLYALVKPEFDLSRLEEVLCLK